MELTNIFKNLLTIFRIAWIFLWLTACAGPIRELYPPLPTQSTKTIYIVSNGWHTGIVIRRSEVPLGRWPQLADFPKEDKYIEVGWGDAGFYQAKQITTRITLKAIFLPTPSVLHVVGFTDSPYESLAGNEILKIQLSGPGFVRLIQFIQDTYAHDAQGQIGPGLYGDSHFYHAKGSYHMFNTCNHWTALALRVAGYPITPFYAFTAGNVVYQIRQAEGI